VISVVICSVEAHKFALVSERYRHLFGGEPHEIIGVHDARSLCEGYNRGLDKSSGDIVIFCHDDIEILTPAFTERLKRHLDRFDGIGVAGTNRLVGPGWVSAGPPHIFGQVAHFNPATGECNVFIYGVPRPAIAGMQAMDGLFLAFRRGVVERLRWDQETFTGFHLYDIDLTFRAYLAGYRLAVVNDLPMIHEAGADFGPSWKQYAALFVGKHASKLGVMRARSFQFEVVSVPSREEALETMTPG
jgi:glycosyltransferase involved in cell wall biosynthesis